MNYTRYKTILLIACIISLQACYATHRHKTGWFDWLWNLFGITHNTNIDNNLFIQQKGNPITISSTKNMENPKNIQLTGITKRIAKPLKIDSISLPDFVQITIDNSVESYVECDTAVFDSGLEFVVVDNEKLKIVLQKDTCLKFNGTGDKPLCTISVNLLNDSLNVSGTTSVAIKQAPLRALTVDGASKVHTVHNNSPTTNSTISSKIPLQTLNVSGNSIVDISDIETTNLQTTISGANNVTLSGTADTQTANINGASKYNTRDLTSKEIAIDVLGNSKAAVNATNLLTGSALGISTLQNYGAAIGKILTLGMSSYVRLGQQQ